MSGLHSRPPYCDACNKPFKGEGDLGDNSRQNKLFADLGCGHIICIDCIGDAVKGMVSLRVLMEEHDHR